MDEEIPWRPLDPFRSAPAASDLLPAKGFGFLRLAAGYSREWHPAPRKQYLMVLEGRLQIEAGTGEKRSFAPGSVLLVTDIAGTGHRTEVLGTKDVMLVWIPVP